MTRRPDFLVIGAMKAGTTSLYRWLAAQPEVWLPSIKEPEFFSDEQAWQRGIAWYESIFAPGPPEALTGEASVAYTDPRYAEQAAARIERVLPEVRLIYLVRHPMDRIRSHYRHEVQRGRERRPFDVAMSVSPEVYADRSCYHRCLSPYLDRFGDSSLLVVRFEDLVSAEDRAWLTVLDHLGVPPRQRPQEAHNVTSQKSGFSTPLRWMWERGLDRRFRRLPQPIRNTGKRVLMREGRSYRALLDTANHGEIPAVVADAVWEDVAQLETRLGKQLWNRYSSQKPDDESTEVK